MVWDKNKHIRIGPNEAEDTTEIKLNIHTLRLPQVTSEMGPL